MKLTESSINLLASALNDPEEAFTPELEEAATGVAGCLTNVLQSSSGQSSGAAQENQSKV